MRGLAIATLGGLLLAGCQDDEKICLQPGIICTEIGTGLTTPNDVVVDPAGTLYVSDFENLVVRARGRDGQVRTVLGNGTLSDVQEGPALATGMSHVGDLLLDGEGGLYVATWHNSRVVRVDLATGVLARVAGLGVRQQYSGNAGPALDAALDLPASLALLPDGRLLVTDQLNQVIRQIDRQTGIIDWFAGRCVIDHDGACDVPVQCPDSHKLACNPAQCDYACTPGFSGELTRSDELRLAFPSGSQALPGGKLAVGGDGTVYIADIDNGRVRAVHADGMVTTLAGGGDGQGDGIAAIDAKLDSPMDIAIGPDGVVFVVDHTASCIRRISVDGTIDTVAGVCGQRGFAGDGQLATAALLDRPLGIAYDGAARRLYIADSLNDVIRAVTIE